MHLSQLSCETERVLAHDSAVLGIDRMDRDDEDFSLFSSFASENSSRPGSFEQRVEEDLDDAIGDIAWHFAED